jgi:predicted DNA-binding transcriptional regulator AlpA
MTVRMTSQAEQPIASDGSSRVPGARVRAAGVRRADANLQSRLITVDEAMAIGAMGRTKFYALAARNEFIVRKLGRATRVDLASFEAYLDGLPTASFSASKESAA